jgi:hypothetical protein
MGSAGPVPVGPDVPAAVLRSWDQAEARLFPLVMARPDLYERALRQVSVLAAQLRETCPDVPALLAEHERGAALAGDLPPDLAGVAPEVLAAAACAMRYRELVAAGVAQRRLAALGQARAQGKAWTVVEESGDEARAPFVPYQRVEAHVPSGRAVIISVEPDETLSRAVHRLDAGELDLATGGLQVGEPLGDYPDAGALTRALESARAEIAGRG